MIFSYAQRGAGDSLGLSFPQKYLKCQPLCLGTTHWLWERKWSCSSRSQPQVPAPSHHSSCGTLTLSLTPGWHEWGLSLQMRSSCSSPGICCPLQLQRESQSRQDLPQVFHCASPWQTPSPASRVPLTAEGLLEGWEPFLKLKDFLNRSSKARARHKLKNVEMLLLWKYQQLT